MPIRPEAVRVGGNHGRHGVAARLGAARGRGLLGALSLGGTGSRRAHQRHDGDDRGREGTRILHPRRRFGQRSIDYRHYLSELARKPQAVRQVLPDLLRDLGEPFAAIWDQLHAAHGPREAARLFAKVLGQLETHGAAVVVPALRAALATGTPLLLALTPARAPSSPIAPELVPARLRDIDVASGCAADYDGWLLGGVA